MFPIYSSIHVCRMRSSRVLYVCGVLVVCLVRNDGCVGWGGGGGGGDPPGQSMGKPSLTGSALLSASTGGCDAEAAFTWAPTVVSSP